jgi:hypothetical protein
MITSRYPIIRVKGQLAHLKPDGWHAQNQALELYLNMWAKLHPFTTPAPAKLNAQAIQTAIDLEGMVLALQAGPVYQYDPEAVY